MRACLLVCAVLLVGAPAASAAQLDPSFAGRGWLGLPELAGDGRDLGPVHDVVVQPDGKVVVAARIGTPFGMEWGVVRFLPDGRVDTAFGAGGAATAGVLPTWLGHGLALQPDGKILLAGSGICDLETCAGVVRWNPDGTLDQGFGSGGFARHNPIRRTSASDVAVQPDGRIVLAGRQYLGGGVNADERGMVMRLLPDGRLDPTFSGDGVATPSRGPRDDEIVAVALQGDRIVVAGDVPWGMGPRRGFAITRLRPDGRLDRSFGRGGRRLVGFRAAYPAGLAITRRGRIVVAGTSGPAVAHAAVVRLTRNGGLDRGFGARGRVHTRLGNPGGVRDMALDGHDRIVLAGYAAPTGDLDYADVVLVRYTPGGRPDRAFAPRGLLRADFTGVHDSASSVAVAGDRIVAAGAFVMFRLGVARYVAG